MYVFDTSSFRELFHFYPRRFPTLWRAFDALVENKEILSVKEVLQEMSVGGKDHPDTEWAKSHKKLFKEPTLEEAQFIAEIFKIEHFQQSLPRSILRSWSLKKELNQMEQKYLISVTSLEFHTLI